MAKRDKAGTRSGAKPPILLLTLTALAGCAVWAAVNTRLAGRIDELPAPTAGGHSAVVSVSLGENWTSYLARFWWGDSLSLSYGRPGGLVTDASGRPVWAKDPGGPEYRWLLEKAQSLGPRTVINHRAVGWPLRVWSRSWVRVGENGTPVREQRVHLAPTAASLVIAGGAGLGAGTLAVVVLRLVRATHRRANGRCHRCGYDIRGVSGPCPECGAVFKQ